MHSKEFSLRLVLIISIFAIYTNLSWSASVIFPQDGKEIYDKLLSLKPGTPVEVAYAALGKPDSADGNMLIWFSDNHETNAAISTVIEETIEVASYYHGFSWQ